MYEKLTFQSMLKANHTPEPFFSKLHKLFEIFLQCLLEKSSVSSVYYSANSISTFSLRS